MPRKSTVIKRIRRHVDARGTDLGQFVAEEVQRGELRPRIEALGRDLRGALAVVLEAVAGASPRPGRLTFLIGLDKSLSSRFVRSLAAPSNLDFMHLVPSPAGLRILAGLVARYADPASIDNLLAATERFELLLDSVPGGRAAIDAQISESSPVALEKRAHIAKQASFKAMSFLLGHFCDVLTTSLFLVPSKNGKRVDGIEIHRRTGLRRMRPSMPLALMSTWADPEDIADENAFRLETLAGERSPKNPAGFILPEFSTQPLPELEVVHDENMTTYVLAGDPSVVAPAQFTSAFRIRNGWPIEPRERTYMLRAYMLHLPCRRMVREVYVAENLYPDVNPLVSFVLPGPRAARRPPRPDGRKHFTEVDLSAPVEQLPPGPPSYTIPGVINHGAAVRYVLERSGHGDMRFRGWRCSMTYPVPLVEMMWWFSHQSFRG